jgi:hypothetical protein
LTCLGAVRQISLHCSETQRKIGMVLKKWATRIGAARFMLALQGFVQILVNLLKKTHRGEPTLIGANQQRKILGHVA